MPYFPYEYTLTLMKGAFYMFVIVLMLYIFAGVCEDIWLQIKK